MTAERELIAQVGMLRCCLLILNQRTAPGAHGEVITCPQCDSRTIFETYSGEKVLTASGVWRWDHD